MNETFKPFQQVLVRDDEESQWMCDLYSHYDDVTEQHVCVGNSFCICIPYEGNEHLLGTEDAPQPKRWRAEEGGSYWYVDFDGITTKWYESFDDFDEQLYSKGNYFRTREEAEEMAEKFKEMLKGE